MSSQYLSLPSASAPTWVHLLAVVRWVRAKLLLTISWVPLPVTLGFLLILIIESLYNLFIYLSRGQNYEKSILPKLLATKGTEERVAIVTGGTTGIGKQVVCALLQANYTLHLPIRNMDRGQALLEELERETPLAVSSKVHLYECDLLDLGQVHRFIANFRAASSRLDLLVNNAGNYNPHFVRSADGVESHLAVHVLATYLLMRDLKALLSQVNGRIINVSSSTHLATHRFSLDCFKDEHTFGRFSGYCQAKYAQLLLTRQLAMDWQAVSMESTVSKASPPSSLLLLTVHPGAVRTEICRDDPLSRNILGGPVQLLPWLQLKPIQGALTLVWAALAATEELSTGAHLHDLGTDEPVNVNIQRDLEAGRGKLLVAFCDVLVRAE